MLINLYTAAFQLINVAVLFYFLKRFFYKPVGEFLKKRREDLKARFTEAEEQREEARKLYEEYRSRMENAREEARAVIQQARDEAAALRTDMLERAKMEASDLIARAREEIEAQKSRALSEIRAKAADLSVMLASSILKETLSPEEHHLIINRVIERMDDREWLQ